ncbi:MAG: hypothetical protein ABI791_04990 [Acidobacteriota bacterium]
MIFFRPPICRGRGSVSGFSFVVASAAGRSGVPSISVTPESPATPAPDSPPATAAPLPRRTRGILHQKEEYRRIARLTPSVQQQKFAAVLEAFISQQRQAEKQKA